ncbi:hypothetical protein [Candidatus Nitrosocosmicus sp. T]
MMSLNDRIKSLKVRLEITEGKLIDEGDTSESENCVILLTLTNDKWVFN